LKGDLWEVGVVGWGVRGNLGIKIGPPS